MSDRDQQDALGMADEEFSNLNIDTAFGDDANAIADREEGEEHQQHASDAEATPAGGGEGEEAEDPQAQEQEEQEETPEGQDDDPEAEGAEGDDDPESGEEGDETPDGSEEAGDEEGEKDKDKEGEEDEKDGDKDKDEDVTTKAFFDRVTAPFKANGREMQIKDPDDVIRLMQMGANYNKKMASLKPALKVVKMLERNKLMDEERLSFLIDLDKKDPTAIAKLVKDSELDPMDLDLEEGQKYKSSDKYAVDERELALDEVIEEIKDSETYSKTLDVVSNRWDDKSRNIVANTPELMRVIDGHMQNGVYEVISTEVEKERTLGRLNGIPDIEAYRQIGDRLNEEGAFEHLANKNNNQAQAQSTTKPNKPSQNTKAEKERKAKRRAASPSKAAPAPSKNQDFNPLSMSDEEYTKQFDDRLL